MLGLRSALSKWRAPGARPAILMYHRVGNVDIDPWELAVTPDNFADHMEYIRTRRTPLPMSEFVALNRNAKLPKDAIAVTFDDGYLDNLTRAKPSLSATGVPATIFVVTSCLATKQPFWWDQLARLDS